MNRTVKRFISRPARHKFESWPGYLLRLADENGLPSIPVLARALKVKPSTLVSMSDSARGQFLRGVTEANLAPPIERPFDDLEFVRRRLWPRRRICPSCLEGKTPVALYFDYPLTLRCAEHQVYLIDHCPVCSKPLTYLKTSLYECFCGHLLSRSKVEKTSHSLDLFESQFAPWRINPDWFLDEGDVFRKEIPVSIALRYIVGILTGRPHSSAPTIPWIHFPDWSVIQKAITPWPHGLAGRVRAAIGPSLKPESVFINNLAMSSIPSLVSLGTTLAQHVARRGKPKIHNGVPMVSLHQVRQSCKLDVAATHHLFNSGYFKNVLTEGTAQGTRYWVSEKEHHQVKALFESTADICTTANILGCSATAVRVLEKAGHLTATGLSIKSRSLRFARAEVDLLLQRFIGFTSSLQLKKEELIPLADVRTVIPSDKSLCPHLPDLLARILSGSVPLFAIDNCRHGWSGLGVRLVDLHVSSVPRG